MHERSEQRFYSKLKDTFVGEKIKGDSGYVNLMNLRQKYFERIEPHIKESVNKKIKTDGAREELYDKLYTFFDAYLNETGTVFFANTQIHKNLYERVYSDRDDVSLFWKTKNLYYVKSEALYDDLETEIDGTTFKFDASSIKHAQGNEKKQLEFHFIGIDEHTLSFKPRYAEQNSYDRIKEYLDGDLSTTELQNYLYDNFPNIQHPQIKIVTNDLDYEIFTKTDFKSILTVKELNDAVNTVVVEFSPYKIEHILKYFDEKNIPVYEDNLRKAFRIYKKQNEVDYFIHKNAEGFLNEQFDIYMYNYLFNDLTTEFSEERVKQIQTIKTIAHQIIDYIAKFEDELKAIWKKPKFVRNSNYVLTLDRLSDQPYLIEKIIKHPGFEKQIEEYKNLHKEWKDEKGKTIKKKWKEFEKAANCSKEEVLIDQNGEKKLNPDFQFLPIDTKHFSELKWEILDVFDHLDKSIDGILIKSDNYQALETLLPKFKESVDLIYIDPPFNTGDDFSYKDKFQDSSWLTLISDRIKLSKELLTDSGRFFLHLDHNANYYARILMNNIFGEENYVESIIWKYGSPSGGRSSGAKFVGIHQEIINYAKNYKQRINNKIFLPYSDKYLSEWFKYEDEDGRVYRKRYRGKSWDKQYLDESPGVPASTVWDDIQQIYADPRAYKDDQRHLSEITGFKTQKPEVLIKRIFDHATKENSLIMDFFEGSGTTTVCAHKMNLNWIGVEAQDTFYETYFDAEDEEYKMGILGRKKNILLGDQSGISQEDDVKWNGGGFFLYYHLEQYEEALSRSRYSQKDVSISEYNFGADQKQLEAIEIDYENEKATIHFESLYEDVDIAETLSNLTGKRIRKLNEKRVIFEDGQEIVFDEMTFGDYPWIKPLIWWNSREANQNESES